MKSISGLAASVLSLILAAPAWTMPIEFIDTTVDQTAQTVRFDIHFTGVPNFSTSDEFNRQEDSFQILTYDDPRRDNLGGGILGENVIGRSVIRGEELHYGNGLPIRDMPSFPSNDPVTQSGGWGTVRATVPVVQDGATLRFATTFAALHVQTDHPFGYGYMALRYGNSVEPGTVYSFWGYCTSGQRCDLSVPLPSMFWPTMLGLVGLTWYAARRRKHAA